MALVGGASPTAFYFGRAGGAGGAGAGLQLDQNGPILPVFGGLWPRRPVLG